MNNQQILSEADMDALTTERENLQTRLEELHTRMQEMESRKLADDTPDAFFQAKRELGDIRQRMAYIEQQLDNATLSAGSDDLSTVNIGNRVNVYNETEDRCQVLDIVATAKVETDAERVTADSPLGQALIGHQAQDKVVVETPTQTTTYKILDILNMPQPQS